MQSTSEKLISYFKLFCTKYKHTHFLYKNLHVCLFSRWFPPPSDGEFLFLHPLITLMEVLFVTVTGSDSQRASGTCTFPVLHIHNKKSFQQKPDGADQPFYLLWWLRTEKDIKHVLFNGLTVFSFPGKCVLWFNFTSIKSPGPIYHMKNVRQLDFV